MKRLILVLGLVLLLALAACDALQTPTQQALPTDIAPAETTGDGGTTEAGPEATSPVESAPPGDQVIPSLPGTVWEWVDLTTPVETISAVDPARYTIEFLGDGTASIKADCNRVQASYVADGSGAISLALGSSTLAACPEDTQDQLFLGALATVASYYSYETDAHLYLSQIADSGTLRFRPVESASAASAGEPATTLTGVTWEWVSTVDPMGQTAAADPTRYTIMFNDDGTAAIKADCNSVPATYITDGTNLSLELGPSTLVGCAADTQDQLFLNGLGSVAAYTVEDGELFIALEADAGTLMFRQAGSVAAESPAGAPAPTLTGGTWEWISTTTSQETVTAADPARYTISFNPDGTVGIQADCNMAGGTYTTGEGNALTVTMGPSTLMACPPDSQADRFLAGLAVAAAYAFDGRDLLIDQAAGAGTLRFRLQGQADTSGAGQTAEPALTGTVWQWVRTTTPGEAVSAVDPARYTIEFMNDGTAAVKADCNQVTATYAIDENGALAIAPGASTMAMCPADSQATAFVSGLAAAASYSLAEGRLVVEQAAGAGTMEFQTATTSSAVPPVKGEQGQAMPGQAGGLTGTTWQWTQLNRAAGNLTVNDPALYTASFNADGTLNLNADCNSGNWTYATGDGGMLTVTPGEISTAFCGSGSLDQIFKGGLTNAMSYRLEEGSLIIDMLYESGSMIFTPAP